MTKFYKYFIHISKGKYKQDQKTQIDLLLSNYKLLLEIHRIEN